MFELMTSDPKGMAVLRERYGSTRSSELAGALLGALTQLRREGPTWLLKRPRFHAHFTPTSASWLNLVERWFAAITEKQIRRGIFRSARELEQAIRTFLAPHNAQPKPFVWTKSADDILQLHCSPLPN